MSMTDAVREAAKKALEDGAELVLGWQSCADPVRLKPLFASTAEACDRLEFGPGAVRNLVAYLPRYKGRKVAVVAKGCDTRSLIQLAQEKLFDRNDVVVIGVPCTGVLSPARLESAAGTSADGWRLDGSDVVVETAGGEKRVPFVDVLEERCAHCRYPNPVEADVVVGDEVTPKVEGPAAYSDVQAFLELPLEDRFRHWERELGRCTRCYACRNACPLCVCKEHCIAESRNPQWLSQSSSVQDKIMFQVIHAMHTAGRCTECGECERACPVGIPILALKRMMNMQTEELFGHVAGTDSEAEPPLFTFKVEEETIPERD